MEATTLDGPSISVPTPSSSDSHIPATENHAPTTIGTSPEYQHRISEISARATIHDPLNILFQWEKTGPTTPFTVDQQYEASIKRVRSKVAAGAFIVESAGFAAVACWQPPGSTAPDRTEEELEEISRDRPIFAKFLKEEEEARRELFGESRQYWNSSLMARDPERVDKGAVRAVLEPFVAEARRKGEPLWLVAGNERARDVYGYFGFRVVKVLVSYPTDRMRVEGGLSEKDMVGVQTWCMAANWPVAKVE
ncbi:hypothetical protein DHEL01_v205332 [Diaporthe helianthi]|uniref:N-acetyltransferase domain-containing protein n=1 Tax=Diaporthe helianthi TaxID=158607 RepID=A0A2P5I181_DIAHE|nr:hypothetical protein DHEL01_v205332 [Diaporthe helianthi]